MYGGTGGKGTLALTGVGLTVGHYSFGLPGIVAAGLALVVLGVVAIRVLGRKRRYVA